MKNFVAFLCLMALCAVALGYPQQQQGSTTVRPARRTTTKMPGHPNNDLIRKGLIDKLCTQKYKPSTTAKPTAPARRTRQAGGNKPQATPTFGPTCSDFDDLTFEQLINRVKGGLRPVSRRP